MESRQGEPIISFASQAEWEAWLDANHGSYSGLWMKVAKKDAGVDTVRIPEALDSALCYGWIDGQRVTYDDQFFLQRYTPRRPRSKWSQINRDKVLELERQGRMKPAGLAEVERARADGRWDAAYESAKNAVVPDDLQRALDENPTAREFFATLTGSNRYAILFRIQDAKRPDTRARRIASFIDMLNEGKKIYP